MNRHVVIVGAGLGGLECGYILAKSGLKVTVLEHDAHVGGCLRSFKRGKITFDSGFHYIGGLREGESLYGLFRYFDLLDLPWQQLDEDCFDEVIIDGKSFPFATGHERFAETLTRFFPNQKDNLNTYIALLKQVGEHITDAFLPRDTMEFYSRSLFARSAYDFLINTISDPLLRKVLSGSSLKMHLQRDTLPLYVFAQINNSFIQSAWRIRGGGQQIADRLSDNIRKAGGEVITQTTVTALHEKENGTIEVETTKGGIYTADYVICDIYPASVVNLLRDSKRLRKIYRHRIESLPDTFGMFTANILIHDDADIPYLNRNIFIHDAEADLWDASTATAQSVMVSYYAGQRAIDLLTPMRWSQVERWANAEAGHRGEDYVEYKQSIVRQCLQLVEKRLPQLSAAIEHVYTSTPLTYHHYTLTPHGSAYGIQKDWHSPETTVLSPATPVPNVYLTGQNLNLHGVLGVSMTSVLTCAQITDMESIQQQLDINHWK